MSAFCTLLPWPWASSVLRHGMISEWVWDHPCSAKPKHLLLGVRSLSQVHEILHVPSVKLVLKSSIKKIPEWLRCVSDWADRGVQAPKSLQPYMCAQAYPVLGCESARAVPWLGAVQDLSPTWLGAVCWHSGSAQGPLNPALHWVPRESCAETRLLRVDFSSVLRDLSQRGVGIQAPFNIQSHSLMSWDDKWGIWGLGFAAAAPKGIPGPPKLISSSLSLVWLWPLSHGATLVLALSLALFSCRMQPFQEELMKCDPFLFISQQRWRRSLCPLRQRRTLSIDHHLSGAGLAPEDWWQGREITPSGRGKAAGQSSFFTQLIFSFKNPLGKHRNIICEGLREKAGNTKLFSPAKG